MAGYTHPLYAASFEEVGSPVRLPRSGTSVLKRRIPGSTAFDAMGCYPLLLCDDWSELPGDLDDLAGELVSMSAVLDPFGGYNLDFLYRCFPDRVVPFKEHFVVATDDSPLSQMSRHHRRYAQKALRVVSVQRAADPLALLPEWTALYSVLIRRHNITGIAAFSDAAFARQLRVPGVVAFRASHQDEPVGMLLWYVHGSVAHYHLGAYSPLGYDLRASFALFWSAIAHFAATDVRWLDLGAGAGLNGSGDDGLSRFKQGWASLTRTAYFCGRIFDHDVYSALVEGSGTRSTGFFPAYRDGEFGQGAAPSAGGRAFNPRTRTKIERAHV